MKSHLKSFKNYSNYRENDNGNEDEGLGDVGGSPTADNSILFKIIGIAWEKYQDDVRSFFGELAKKDDEIAEQIQKLDHGNQPDSQEDQTQVQPNPADNGGGGGDQDWE